MQINSKFDVILNKKSNKISIELVPPIKNHQNISIIFQKYGKNFEKSSPKFQKNKKFSKNKKNSKK